MTTAEVAEWVASMTWSQVPGTTRRVAVEHFRDTAAVLAGGSTTVAATRARSFAETQPGAAPVIFTASRSTPTMAAFANGVAASALDFDDGHYLGGGVHPSAPVLGALLTLACDMEVLEGSELLTAYVVGLEIAIRTGYLSWPENTGRWYSCAGHHATIGAAAACAKVLGLDSAGIRQAMLIAWSHCPRATFSLSAVKESIGWGAATACSAALLARHGFLGYPGGADAPLALDHHPESPFELPEASSDGFVTSLGTVFECESLYLKPYAACRYTHAAADALLELVQHHDLDPTGIRWIRVGTLAAATGLHAVAPATLEAAQYSFPFVLGAIALHRRAGLSEMRQEMLHDADRLALASKVSVVADLALDRHYPEAYPGWVEVGTGSRTLAAEAVQARGARELALSEDEQLAKAVATARPVFGAQAEEAVARWGAIARLSVVDAMRATN